MSHISRQIPSGIRGKLIGAGVSSRSICLSFMLLLVLSAIPAWGQDNATITGYVTDPSGAVVPNASISVVNNATNQTRETVSNAAGSFRFANVGVGTYTMTVVAQGFQKYSKTGIVVNVAQTLDQDAVLAVGSQAQTVTVTADALQVQTETSEVSTLISGTQVEQLATNGRNITSLAALGLGVSNTLPAYSEVNTLTSANGISFNGTRSTHNNNKNNNNKQKKQKNNNNKKKQPSQDA